MITKTRVPVATIDVTGQTYGGAYWNPSEFQVTVTDEDDFALVRLLDTSGAELDEVALNHEQARRLIEAVGRTAPDTQVPNLSVEVKMALGDDSTHDVALTWQLEEIADWLSYFLGDETWDPENDQWE